jgi:hypothetical protein
MAAMTAWPSLHEDMFLLENADFAWLNPDLSWPLDPSPSRIANTSAFSFLGYTQMDHALNELFDSGQDHIAAVTSIPAGLGRGTNGKDLSDNENHNGL